MRQVSWAEAMEVCRRLSQGTHREHTLPSEARWAHSCRAGIPIAPAFKKTWTPDLTDGDGRYTDGSGSGGDDREATAVVASLPANAGEWQDMYGNVWEWRLDRWHNFYTGPVPGDDGWQPLDRGWRDGEFAAWRMLLVRRTSLLPCGLPPQVPRG